MLGEAKNLLLYALSTALLFIQRVIQVNACCGLLRKQVEMGEGCVWVSVAELGPGLGPPD